MSIVQLSSRPRREKVFGAGRPLPLDRNAKHRIITKARALTRRTAKGKHYGELTAKCLAVLEALLWTFHNAKSGLCFPSYVRIAEAAGCCEATAKKAVKALERCGLLSWVNRLRRVREYVDGLFGAAAGRTRVIRTSNGYRFTDPRPQQAPENWAFSSKASFKPETSNQDLFYPTKQAEAPPSSLEIALARLGQAINGRAKMI